MANGGGIQTSSNISTALIWNIPKVHRFPIGRPKPQVARLDLWSRILWFWGIWGKNSESHSGFFIQVLKQSSTQGLQQQQTNKHQDLTKPTPRAELKTKDRPGSQREPLWPCSAPSWSLSGHLQEHQEQGYRSDAPQRTPHAESRKKNSQETN